MNYELKLQEILFQLETRNLHLACIVVSSWKLGYIPAILNQLIGEYFVILKDLLRILSQQSELWSTKLQVEPDSHEVLASGISRILPFLRKRPKNWSGII